VLQERQVLRLGSNEPTPVDVRVIAATHRDLRAMIAAGTFREDLYYRLHILPLHLPALRQRPADVPIIAAELLKRALARHGAPTAHARALRLLLPHLPGYGWPGNVRELENVVERVALLFADDGGEAPVDEAALRAVMPELLEARPPLPRLPGAAPVGGGAGPDLQAAPADLRAAREAEERRQIGRVLGECGGNLSEAARRLGVGRTTLYRKLGGPPRG